MRRIRQTFIGLSVFISLFVTISFGANAAPYAAVVVDARDGKVLYSRNGNQPLHPASLTKMMTLYIAFSEIEAGRLSLNTPVRISKNAAAEPPSKIGLKAGQTIELRYLLRAAAIKSANDAATAIGEAVAGSEQNFAVYMTQVARALGMKNTQFKNAHGLTQSGHYSSAADMAILGRHLVYDFPKYYNLFSREYASTPLGNFRNSNIRFLKDYPGADGIKTGYTKAAGFNLVGSANRNGSRVIVSMFGGQSSYQRNAQIGALLDLGFRQARAGNGATNLARVRLQGAPRTAVAKAQPATPAPAPQPAPTPAPQPQVAAAVPAPAAPVAAPTPQFASIAPKYALRPPARATARASQPASAVTASSTPASSQTATNSTGKLPTSVERPATRPETLIENSVATLSENSTAETSTQTASADVPPPDAPIGDYAIQLGAKPSKDEAQSYIIATSLSEKKQLAAAKDQVISVNLNGTKMYRPRFSGVTKEAAYNVCSKIQSRNEQCYVIAPDQGG